MEKIRVNITINDYKITSIGSLNNNIIIVNDKNTNLEFDLKKNILKRENNEMKQIIDYEKNKFRYLLKEINQELVGKIETITLTNKDKKVIINYRIEDEEFNLNLNYEIIDNNVI